MGTSKPIFPGTIKACRENALQLTIRILGPGDREVLSRVAPGVFDHAVQDALAEEFLRDPRHHLVVALDGDLVVGMVSAIHYVHPDKRPELWINEVGVAGSHREQGVASRLLEAMLDVGRQCGCHEAWVLTDRGNA